MEEVQSTLHPEPTINERPNALASTASTCKRGCLSITATLQQGFRYINAIVLGRVKKMTAKNEKEATEADLLASKMQVDATDDAENTKKLIDKSH